MRSVVLCYHAVSPTWRHRLSLAPDLLLQQVRTLRRFAHVHVTFDDAFRSIESVIPELLRIEVPVTIFVCSGYADRGGAPLVISELETEDAEDLEGLRTMAWDQLRTLSAEGVTIGSHGVSHAHLPSLDDGDLTRELEEAKQRIGDEIGQAPSGFAYPFGEHDERVRAGVRAAGYERGFALRCLPGDPYATPRVDLYTRHSPFGALVRAAPQLLLRKQHSRPATDLPKDP